MPEHYYGSYGQPIFGEVFAEYRSGETSLPFYRFIVQGTTVTQFKLAGAKGRIAGVTVPDELMMNSTSTTGARAVRTGYRNKEPMATKRTGIAYIELGTGGGTKGNLIESDANGKGVVYTKPTIASTPTQANVQDVRDRNDIVCGELLETGAEGDIVAIDLDKR